MYTEESYQTTAAYTSQVHMRNFLGRIYVGPEIISLQIKRNIIQSVFSNRHGMKLEISNKGQLWREHMHSVRPTVF